MKWRVRKPNARFRALHWWHKWFAWYPVRVPTKGRQSGMVLVWLETVERKGDFSFAYDLCDWDWSYRWPKEKQ